MNANETIYSANIPNVCQKYINGAINPPNGPSCFSSLYSTISGHNATFSTCYGDAKPEIYDDDKPCFQYCVAGDFVAEKAMYECLKKSNINFGCTGKRDEVGNFSIYLHEERVLHQRIHTSILVTNEGSRYSNKLDLT